MPRPRSSRVTNVNHGTPPMAADHPTRVSSSSAEHATTMVDVLRSARTVMARSGRGTWRTNRGTWCMAVAATYAASASTARRTRIT